MDIFFLKNFIQEWQTIIGSALGPFLAFVLSAIAFWLRSIYIDLKKRKESTRQIEIAITMSLEDLLLVRNLLNSFGVKIKKMINETPTDEVTYSLEWINFPPINKCFNDSSLSTIKTKSYYLHNKILNVIRGINNTNKYIDSMEDKISFIYEMNKYFVEKTKPLEQKKTYTDNLNQYLKSIDKFHSYVEEGIKNLAQIKVYNSKILKKNFLIRNYVIWKYESINFKYFKDKECFLKEKKEREELGLLDFVDKKIEDEVSKNLVSHSIILTTDNT